MEITKFDDANLMDKAIVINLSDDLSKVGFLSFTGKYLDGNQESFNITSLSVAQ